MPFLNNEVIISSAGSRKTTYLVDSAICEKSEKILILAYTIKNLEQIRQYIIDKKGFIPTNITIQSWHAFVLQDYIRPYQNFLYSKKRIESIYYPENLNLFNKSRRFIKKDNTEKYYLVGGKYIISEHLSEFGSHCNILSKGMVISRLNEIYDRIYIDEFQDLAGYDFDIVEQIMRSPIETILVGDCRQATYFTNCSPKYKQFKGSNIIQLVQHWYGLKLCVITKRNECYRSNQRICDFSDKLYPNLPKTNSKLELETGHDGIFTVPKNEVKNYIEKYNPTILRYSRSTKVNDHIAFNFGEVKGQSFDRVLIYPTEPIRKYLKNGDETQFKNISKSKFYVAITRARYSVGFIYDGKTFF
ncbi:RNA helicase [Gramella sp. Hel_I_59]|uniref:UvrD-helicase domain-containing protein n=1 Tax=Gramella sp. Hel_I_59 TaxID=1249978 RepID=UPI001154D947|nr:UvrD-helicase domain-containing protein [Gramella sp. Hel_I_59]TQI71987.1 RNA helicase [Gramella sp. Hel_I_59]